MSYNKETGMWEGFIYKIWNDVNDKIYIGQTYSTIKERWHGHQTACISDYKGKSILYNAMRCYGREKFHIEELQKIICNSKEELMKTLNYLEEKYILEFHTCIYDPLCNGYNTEMGGNNKHVPGKPVVKYDLDLNYIEEYDSIMEASRYNDIDNATIWAVCHHYYYTAAGFVWAFKDEEPLAPNYDASVNNRQEKSRIYWEKWREEHPKTEKIKNPPISKAMSPEKKKIRKLERIGWDGRRICIYNAFGELLNIYEDMIDACKYISISTQILKKNLNGENLKYKRYIIRYEGDSFNKYPISKDLQAVKMYDLQGYYITRFSSHKEAEDYLGCPRGEITKVIKRGGSCKGYIIVPYYQCITRKLNRIDKIYEMIDDYGNVVKEFPSGKSVARFFDKTDVHHQLTDAVNNNRKYKGYFWKIKEEFPINILMEGA